MVDSRMHPDALAYMTPSAEDIKLVSYEEQSASPYYLELTTNKPTASKLLLQQSEFPVGCVINPIYPNEELPEVYYGNTAVLRCVSCKGYVSPFIGIDNEGWTCAL